MVGGEEMSGGYGTRAGSLKSPWINYIRAERREERQTKVPRKQRYKLGRLAQEYGQLDRAARARIPREDFYSEAALRPRRQGGPSQNPWILFTKARRAAGDKRPLRELSEEYKAMKAQIGVPVQRRDAMVDVRTERREKPKRRRDADLDEKEEFEQRPQRQRGEPLLLTYDGSGRSRRYRPY